MNKERKMNIEVIKKILGTLPDGTLLFSDKLRLNLSDNNGGNFEGVFDRMLLECDEEGKCTVWFDELGERGLENTYQINDFTDSEIEKVLCEAFNQDIVDATRKYLAFHDTHKDCEPKFAICDVCFDGDSEGEFVIKLSCDVVSDDEDNKIGYYCGDGFNELVSLFDKENGQDFVVLDVKEYTNEI